MSHIPEAITHSTHSCHNSRRRERDGNSQGLRHTTRVAKGSIKKPGNAVEAEPVRFGGGGGAEKADGRRAKLPTKHSTMKPNPERIRDRSTESRALESSHRGKVRGFESLENGDEIGGTTSASIKKGLLTAHLLETFRVKSFTRFQVAGYDCIVRYFQHTLDDFFTFASQQFRSNASPHHSKRPTNHQKIIRNTREKGENPHERQAPASPDYMQLESCYWPNR